MYQQIKIILFSLIAVVILGIVYIGTNEGLRTRLLHQESTKSLIGGEYTLTDHHGKTYSSAMNKGQLQLIYFGFTHCPDVCPTDIAIISEALENLGNDADAVTPIFITIDPKRDTPEVMKEFLSNFYPSFIGLTGSETEIKQVEASFKVYAHQGEKEKNGNYTMDHSAITYLMDANGQYITHFSHDTPVEEIEKAIRENL